jgi:Predicted membrane protein
MDKTDKLYDNVQRLYVKYREQIIYLICGGLTTGVDFGIYWLLTRFGAMSEVPAQAVSVAAAIVFAYVVNKRWVFRDMRKKFAEIATQFASFASMRLLSGAFQTLCIWLFVEQLGLYDMAVKLVVAVVVVLLNYMFSKLIIFKKPDTRPGGAPSGTTGRIK